MSHLEIGEFAGDSAGRPAMAGQRRVGPTPARSRQFVRPARESSANLQSHGDAQLLVRLRALLRPSALEHEMQDEMQTHLDRRGHGTRCAGTTGRPILLYKGSEARHWGTVARIAAQSRRGQGTRSE